jgi:hypothetical protein
MPRRVIGRLMQAAAPISDAKTPIDELKEAVASSSLVVRATSIDRAGSASLLGVRDRSQQKRETTDAPETSRSSSVERRRRSAPGEVRPLGDGRVHEVGQFAQPSAAALTGPVFRHVNLRGLDRVARDQGRSNLLSRGVRAVPCTCALFLWCGAARRWRFLCAKIAAFGRFGRTGIHVGADGHGRTQGCRGSVTAR